MAEKQKTVANVPGEQDAAGDTGEENVLLAAGSAEVIDDQEDGDSKDDSEDDPVRRAEREVEQANNKLADAKDKAKRDDEIAKAIEQYRAVQFRLEADEAGLNGQLREGREELAATPDEKDAVRAVKEEVSNEITRLGDAVDRRRERLERDRTKLAEGKVILAETKDEFEGLKNRGKGVQDKHRAAQALVKDAFDAIPRKRTLAHYLLAHRLDPTINGEPKPIEVAAFSNEIKRTSADFGRRSRRLADLEVSIKRKEKKLADDEKTLAELVKNRDATIRERLAALA